MYQNILPKSDDLDRSLEVKAHFSQLLRNLLNKVTTPRERAPLHRRALVSKAEQNAPPQGACCRDTSPCRPTATLSPGYDYGSRTSTKSRRPDLDPDAREQAPRDRQSLCACPPGRQRRRPANGCSNPSTCEPPQDLCRRGSIQPFESISVWRHQDQRRRGDHRGSLSNPYRTQL